MKARIKGVAVVVALALACTTSVSPPAHAGGIPVIDVSNLMQAIQQYQQMVQQLEQLKAQLEQAKRQYEALTGGRGMESLLSGENREVIPTSWQETLAIMQGGGQISDLARSIKDQASKVDTATLDRLAPEIRSMTETYANTAASEQAAAGTAYDNASQRFRRLQALMDAIPRATDLKAIEDLQARIQVEQLMLQNETIKMQALAQAAHAQQRIENQQMREMAIDRPSGKTEPDSAW